MNSSPLKEVSVILEIKYKNSSSFVTSIKKCIDVQHASSNLSCFAVTAVAFL